MANLLCGFVLIIFFSESYYRTTGARHLCSGLLAKPSIIKCLTPRLKACSLRLWLYLGCHANRLLVSQQPFRNLGSYFRQGLVFVLDLPIGLMKFSLTMIGIDLSYENGRNGRRWLFVSALLFCLFVCLGFSYHPAAAQGQNGFTQPAEGDVLSGIVIVQGTAADANFLRYELAFRRESGSSSDWIVFAQGDQPVINGTLAVWDTTVGSSANRVFPDGRYQLRLRVVRQDFNYDEYFVVNLTIANDSGTPTPTPTLTTTVSPETITPSGVETTLPVLTQPPPDVLPSLTPFPTPSPQATPVNEPLGPGNDGNSGDTEARQGVFEQISGIDTGQFESAFWQGVRFVVIIFGLLAAYVLLRGVFRRLWRLLANRYLR